MSKHKVSCPVCGATFQVSATMDQKVVNCKKCSGPFKINLDDERQRELEKKRADLLAAAKPLVPEPAPLPPSPASAKVTRTQARPVVHDDETESLLWAIRYGRRWLSITIKGSIFLAIAIPILVTLLAVVWKLAPLSVIVLAVISVLAAVIYLHLFLVSVSIVAAIFSMEHSTRMAQEQSELG